MGSSWVRWSGLAALVGGAMWVFKATVILLGVGDPGWMVVSSQALLACGIIGLVMAVPMTRLARIAQWLALISILLGVVHTLHEFLFSQGQTPIIINIATAVGTLALVGGLICAGVVVRRAGVHAGLLRSMPLALGVLFIPVMIAGAALIHEEVPIILLGLGWMWLGALLMKAHTSVRALPR